MPIPFLTQTHKRNLLARSTQSITPSFSRTIGAQYGEVGTHTATAAITRMIGINTLAAETGGITGIRSGTAHGGSGVWQENRKLNNQQRDQAFATQQQKNHHWASRDEALAEIKARGYSETDVPISDIGANILVVNEIMNRLDAQAKRQDIISRGSDGRGTALFATALVASLTDPIEFGVNLIPWVGPAKRLAALQKAGTSTFRRLAVRARFGAVEGAIGTALIEPFPLMAASMDNLDYDVEDSIMSLTYGTILGSGMHMGIGYVKDKITVTRGGSLVTRPELNKGPQGATGAALDALPQHVLRNNFEIAINASVQNRNIRVDEFMSLGDINFRPGQRLDLGDGRSLVFDKDGNAGIFGTNNKKATLAEIIDDPGMPIEVRRLAEDSKSVDELAAKINKVNNQVGAIDRRNVNSLREVLNEKEAQPLSTFLENNGGLKADDAFGKFVDTKTRPKLFKKEGKGGMTQNEAMKKARDAGYDLPEGKGTFFMRSLQEDISGKNRILTVDAETKLREHAEVLRKQGNLEVDKIVNRQSQDLLGFSEGFHAPENIRTFDAPRTADIERMIEKHKEMTNEDLQAGLKELEIAVKDIAEQIGEPGLDLRVRFDEIDATARIRNEGRENIVNCILGGV